MTINGKTLSVVQGLVTATSTNEGNFRTGVGDVLAQVNANQEALAVSVNCPQVVTTLTSGSSYTVPSNAIAIYVRASGGGGGGGKRTSVGEDYLYANGTAGGDTTISNSSISLAITAKGGTAGSFAFSGLAGGSSASPSGSVQTGRGAEGGRGRQDGTASISARADANGKPAALASVYIKSSTVGGKVLTYSIGAGGAGATSAGAAAEAGQPGFIELWIW